MKAGAGICWSGSLAAQKLGGVVEPGIVGILEKQIVELVGKGAEGVKIPDGEGIFLERHIFGDSRDKCVRCFPFHCRTHGGIIQSKTKFVDFPDIVFGQGNDGCPHIGYGF